MLLERYKAMTYSLETRAGYFFTSSRNRYREVDLPPALGTDLIAPTSRAGVDWQTLIPRGPCEPHAGRVLPRRLARLHQNVGEYRECGVRVAESRSRPSFI